MSDKIAVVTEEIVTENDFGREVETALVPTSEPIPPSEPRGAFDILSEALEKNPAFQQALANKLANRPPLFDYTRKQPLNKARQWVIGFGPTPVPPYGTITNQQQPRVLFRAEKIINTGNGDGLALSSLFVGNRSQLPPNVSIPLSNFNANGLDRGMIMDTCDPALMITMQVQNSTSAILTFSAALYGKAVL